MLRQAKRGVLIFVVNRVYIDGGFLAPQAEEFHDVRLFGSMPCCGMLLGTGLAS